jgi:hypothetical protein
MLEGLLGFIEQLLPPLQKPLAEILELPGVHIGLLGRWFVAF